MIRAFPIKGHVASYTLMEPVDTVNTKGALQKLGFYKTPKYGMTPYPDRYMFEGLKAFQKEQDFLPDGTMRAGGPTARRIQEVMDGMQTTAREIGEWARAPISTVPVKPATPAFRWPTMNFTPRAGIRDDALTDTENVDAPGIIGGSKRLRHRRETPERSLAKNSRNMDRLDQMSSDAVGIADESPLKETHADSTLQSDQQPTTPNKQEPHIPVYKPPPLANPIKGGKLRGSDSKFGAGYFGASRLRNGILGIHEGIDISADSGAPAMAVVTGEVTKVGNAYKADPQYPEAPNYRYIEIKTDSGYYVRQFYIAPSVKVKDLVTAGETVIGQVQDLGSGPIKGLPLAMVL